jgi:hypothetical protein
MATVANRGPLRLRGAPGMVGGTLVLPDAPPVVDVKLALEGKQLTPVPAQVARIGAKGLSSLRVDLPRWTPPGRYQGTATIGAREERITVDVEPVQLVRVEPRRLVVRGRSKQVVQAEVTLSNVGNTSYEVRGVAMFALYDPSSLERATAKAFQSSGQSTKRGVEDRFVDRLAAELREGYGGNVRLKVETGAGPLEPGESRAVQASLHLPDGLQPGRVYEGVWRIADLGYNVAVDTGGGISEESVR